MTRRSATVKLAARGAPALVIPAAAVQEIDGQQIVYVEDAQQRFHARPVRATLSEGLAQVHSGLTAGERVAAQGSYMIKGQAAQKAGE